MQEVLRERTVLKPPTAVLKYKARKQLLEGKKRDRAKYFTQTSENIPTHRKAKKSFGGESLTTASSGRNEIPRLRHRPFGQAVNASSFHSTVS